MHVWLHIQLHTILSFLYRMYTIYNKLEKPCNDLRLILCALGKISSDQFVSIHVCKYALASSCCLHTAEGIYPHLPFLGGTYP